MCVWCIDGFRGLVNISGVLTSVVTQEEPVAGVAIYEHYHEANASFSLANRDPLPLIITQHASLIGS